jgi:aminoglycoside phosphotransferase (APT) family kinase protein
MHTPAADIRIDDDLVHALLAEQHPELLAGTVDSRRTLRYAGGGWDNALYRLGDDLAVRLPRRDVAAHLIVHEQRWLPSLAVDLPVPVPAPVRVGAPSTRFPWAWSVVRWIDGVDGAEVRAVDRVALAVPLARFVTALHAPAPRSVDGDLHPDVPLNPVRGVPLVSRDRAVRERLRELSGAFGLPAARQWDVTALGRVWNEAVSAPRWHGAPIWLHGDLHPGNLLLDAGGGLAGVIDFGDLTAGDPATDLATAWLTFEPEARAVFRAVIDDASHPESRPDAATWLRARGWALCMATALATHSDDNPRMLALGVHALAQLLTEAWECRSPLLHHE